MLCRPAGPPARPRVTFHRSTAHLCVALCNVSKVIYETLLAFSFTSQPHSSSVTDRRNHTHKKWHRENIFLFCRVPFQNENNHSLSTATVQKWLKYENVFTAHVIFDIWGVARLNGWGWLVLHATAKDRKCLSHTPVYSTLRQILLAVNLTAV